MATELEYAQLSDYVDANVRNVFNKPLWFCRINFQKTRSSFI